MEEQIALSQKGKTLRNLIARHPLAAFVVLAFAITWVSWPLSWFVNTGSLSGFEIIAAMGPALAAMAISAILNPAPSGSPARERRRLFFLALGGAMALLAFRRFWTTTGLVAIPAIPPTKIIYPSLVAVLMDLLAAAAAALVISGIHSSKTGVRDLLHSLNPRQSKVRWYWFFIAIGIYPAVILIGNAIASLAGMPAFGGAAGPWYWMIPDVVLMFFSPFLMGGFEEPGWRAFALPFLQKKSGPLRSSLIIAPIWAFWHLPMLWRAGFPGGVFGTLFWTLEVFLLAILGTALYNRSGGSLLVVVFWHAAYDITSVYMPVTSLATFLWLVLGIVLLVWVWRKPETFRLSY